MNDHAGRRVFNSLFGRFTIGFALIQVILVTLFGHWALTVIERVEADEFINQSLAKSLVIVTMANASPSREDLEQTLEDLVLTGHAANARALPAQSTTPLADAGFGMGGELTSGLYRTIARSAGTSGSVLVIDYDEKPILGRIAQTRRNGAFLTLALLVASVLSSTALGFVLSRSINRLVLLARRLAQTDSADVVRTTSSLNEIRTLENALFEMRSEIQATARAMAGQKAILDSAPTGIVTLSDEGEIQTVNIACTEITGYGQSALQGRMMEELLIDHDRHAFVSMMVTPGGRTIQEVLLRHALGHTVSVRIGFSQVEIHGERFFTLAMQDITNLNQVSAGDYWLSSDPLTGLPNRAALMKYLASSVEFSRRTGTPGAVMFVDFDRFKAINDTLGHAAGDLFLQSAANRFQSKLRSGDFVARFAGDEFVVVINGLNNPGDEDQIAQAMLDMFAEPVVVGGKDLFASLSIGICRFPEHGTSVEGLLHCADIAMYGAKHAGGQRFMLFNCDDTDARMRKMQVDGQLRRALENGEFHLEYQPIYNLESGSLARFEALLRWDSPTLGLVPPDEFIPICETNGLIVPIGEWVLSTAYAQACTWHREHGSNIGMSVNLSGRQFGVMNLADRLVECADPRAPGSPPIDLEITESTIIEVGPRSVEVMQSLRDSGFLLSIDDFGTGYSSLSYLSRFPVTCLKIDQSFVAQLGIAGSSADAVVAAVAAMGHSLGVKVLAEGIETVEQQDALLQLGVTFGQGYLLGGPMVAASAGKLVAQEANIEVRKHTRIPDPATT